MKKTLLALTAALILSAAASVTSFAYGWQNDGGKWWYGTNADNSDYYRHTWKCIDGSWYYFEGDGYMAHDTTIGGIYVGHDGTPDMSPLCPDLYHYGMKINRGHVFWVDYCNEYITLRSAPSTQASGITYIPLQASVTYLEKANTDFSKVEYLGMTGYVLSRYLGYFKPEASGQMTVVNCCYGVQLRNTPSGNGAEIGLIPPGAVVKKLIWEHENRSDYCLIDYKGITGYLHKDYLR